MRNPSEPYVPKHKDYTPWRCPGCGGNILTPNYCLECDKKAPEAYQMGYLKKAGLMPNRVHIDTPGIRVVKMGRPETGSQYL
jgi:hypothetical protein